MPLHRAGKGKWQWGEHGKVYSSKAAAERQARAIYANGYRGDTRAPEAPRREGPQQDREDAEPTYQDLYSGKPVV